MFTIRRYRKDQDYTTSEDKTLLKVLLFSPFAISLPPPTPDRKSNSNSKPTGYIRRLPSPRSHRGARHYSVCHIIIPPAPPPPQLQPGPGSWRRRRPRKRSSANSAARRHGGSRFPSPGPAGPAAAMSPLSQGGHSSPGLVGPALRRSRRRFRPPAEQRCSPWWRMAVDSPRQIRV